MEFKDIIRQLRNERNMNTTQLAGQFEKTEAAIRAWEAGRSKPDADTLIKLAAYFECSVDYLLGISKFKDIAQGDKYKEALEQSVGNFNSAFDGFDKRTQEEIIHAFIRTVTELAKLPHGRNLVIYEFVHLLNFLERAYARATKYTTEWNEYGMLQMIGECFTFQKRIHAGFEHTLESFITEAVRDGAIDERKKKFLLTTITAFFPLSHELQESFSSP